jgi:uncharacterized repeat protein (TIGR03803 family)
MKNFYLIILAIGAVISQLSAQSPHFFGITTTGGGSGAGTIYRTDTNGTNLSLIDTFDVVQNGKNPSNQELLEVNGKMYGVTNLGGDNDAGVLFEFDPATGNYTVRHNFDDSTGKNPNCYLLLSSNGKIYGTATRGGVNNTGTIFEYNTTTNVLVRKQSMGTSIITGRNPNGKMVEASSGVFYGVCQAGGALNSGTVFKYTLSTNIIEQKDDFESNVSGRNVYGGLMKASNGILYGMTSYGGIGTNAGTLYQFDIAADSIKVLVHFNGLNGRNGRGVPIQIGGDLYGLTYYGNYSSSTGKGLLYKYNIAADTISRVRTFGSTNTGYYPTGNLVPSTAGKYFIVMQTGGISNNYAGTISEWNLSTNAFTNRKSFNAGLNGSRPLGNLKKSSVNGKYYGLASNGGSGDFGTIYEFDAINDTIINKHNFSPSNKGKRPSGTLVKAPNGKLYGITEEGGLYGNGTIFEVDPTTQILTKKIDFTDAVGRMPTGGLTLATNGKLYGVTIRGGAVDRGVIFEYNIATNTLLKLKNIFPLGYNPVGALIQAANGKLYGTSTYGGSAQGMLYSYDITLDTLIRHDSFRSTIDGSYPRGKLMQATNGKLYGTTSSGGTHGKGTVFEFDITADSIKVLDHFTDANGATPYGGLIQTTNGNLYGVTTRGNTSGIGSKYGVIYQFDLIADTIKALAEFFNVSTGFGGYGELLEASNGNLYVTSSSKSGGNSEATLNEFNPLTNSFVAITRLLGQTYGSLIELVSPNNASIKEGSSTISQLIVYPNPTNSILNFDTKGERIQEVRIFNISGNLIDSRLKGTKFIDVSHYKNGVYIIQVQTQNVITLSRFIKN